MHMRGPHANPSSPHPPVIPAKAGTQAPVSITHQPVIATKIPHFHAHARPTCQPVIPPPPRHPRESGDPGPRLHNPPTRNCHENTPLSCTCAAHLPTRYPTHPSVIPAKAGTQALVSITHQPATATKSAQSHTPTRPTCQPVIPPPPVIPAKAARDDGVGGFAGQTGWLVRETGVWVPAFAGMTGGPRPPYPQPANPCFPAKGPVPRPPVIHAKGLPSTRSGAGTQHTATPNPS